MSEHGALACELECMSPQEAQLLVLHQHSQPPESSVPCLPGGELEATYTAAEVVPPPSQNHKFDASEIIVLL